jgi:hypothetical protein
MTKRLDGSHHQSLHNRGGRPPFVPVGLRGWLLEHPQAWSGWPTIEACDQVRERQLTRRLEAAGCPGAFAEAVRAVNQVVAEIRLERREKLAKQARRTGDAW